MLSLYCAYNITDCGPRLLREGVPKEVIPQFFHMHDVCALTIVAAVSKFDMVTTHDQSKNYRG